MSKRLFVGGLPRSYDNSQLEEMFSKIGKVASATVIMDRDTGQGKGFGFVEMEVDAEADTAISQLNETELEGRKITVNVARPREERPRFDSRDGGGRGGRY